eukprot:COSAG05_NODE_5239_length_1228_cov_2.531274_1_plen_273_part_10
MLLLRLLEVEGGSTLLYLREHPVQRIRAILALIGAQQATDKVRFPFQHQTVLLGHSCVVTWFPRAWVAQVQAAEMLTRLDQDMSPWQAAAGDAADYGDDTGPALVRRRGVHAGVCGSTPCANGGTCVEVLINASNSYTCTCTREWVGRHCESMSAEALAVKALTVLIGGAANANGLDHIWGAAPWNSGHEVTPLMAAAHQGWIHGVLALHQMGASAAVQMRGRELDALSFLLDGLRSGTVPLQSAAVVASILLDAGANPSVSSWSGVHGREER